MTDMKDADKTQNKIRSATSRLRQYLLIGALVWIIIVAGSLIWDITSDNNSAIEFAKLEAQTIFNKDEAFRVWVSSHGGVYVEPDDRTPPNPYLSHIADRDITTTEGENLTLMNPAYVIRQVQEDYQDVYGVQGQITSLNLLNPINAPDEWEQAALLAFEEGATEVSAVSDIDRVSHIRYMEPLITQEACLKCHSQQGYSIGDVRGGISVSVPLDSYYAIQNRGIAINSSIHGGILLVGLGGIVLIGKRSKQRIVQRIESEQELQQAHDELEIKVEERTKELKESQGKLVISEKLATIGQLATGVAHELRNPLAIINNAAYYLKMKLGDEDKVINQHLDVMKHEIFRSSNVISGLLDLAKAKEPILAEVVISSIIEEALKQVRIPDNVKVDVEKGDTALTAHVDANQIERVFGNLVTNAVQAMYDGGTLTIRSYQDKDYIAIGFCDTGKGIPPENLDKIFDPMFTTKADLGCMGIGLALSKIIVEAHRGSIEVESEVGKGTKFTIKLPNRKDE